MITLTRAELRGGLIIMIHSPFATSLFIWIGIAFCIIQSAIFSGLNLAIFSVSKLRLEVEAAGGNRDAISLLGLRKDSNLTLSTVLWGNVTGAGLGSRRAAHAAGAGGRQSQR